MSITRKSFIGALAAMVPGASLLAKAKEPTGAQVLLNNAKGPSTGLGAITTYSRPVLYYPKRDMSFSTQKALWPDQPVEVSDDPEIRRGQYETAAKECETAAKEWKNAIEKRKQALEEKKDFKLYSTTTRDIFSKL
jgi:hypothetical protein